MPSESIARCFDAQTQEAAKAAAVRLGKCSSSGLRANVFLDRRVQVDVDVRPDGALVAYCSGCRIEEEKGCAHLWAAIADAEREGFLGDAARSARLVPAVGDGAFNVAATAIVRPGGPGDGASGAAAPSASIVPHRQPPTVALPSARGLTLRPSERSALRLAVTGAASHRVGAGSADVLTWDPDPASRQRAATSAWRRVLSDVARPDRAATLPEGTEILYGLDLEASRASRALEIVVLQSRPRKRGDGVTKPAVLPVSPELIERVSSELDRKALGLLIGCEPAFAFGQAPPRRTTRLTTWSGLGETLIPLLCESRRFVPLTDGQPGEPFTWDPDGPWELWLELIEPDLALSETWLRTVLRRGDERLLPSDAELVSSGLVVNAGRVTPLLGRGASTWLYALGWPGDLRVPLREASELVLHLLRLSDRPRLDLPAELTPEVLKLPPRPVLQARREQDRKAAIFLAVRFRYGELDVNPDLDETLVPYLTGGRVLERDLPAEEAATRGLDELLSVSASGLRGIDPKGFIGLARSLIANGWVVEADGRTVRSKGVPKIDVKTGIDWLDLEGAIEFDGGTASLDAVLRASREGSGWVTLSDGSLGLLPEEWLAKSAPLLRLGSGSGGKLRFRTSQAVLLGELLSGDGVARLDEGFRKLRQRIEKFSEPSREAVPKGFKGTLRPYQNEALGWFRYLRDVGFGGCLADDMGLGKTVQTLALVQARVVSGEADGPTLVVAPRSLIHNWIEEAERFVPNLFIHDHSAPGRGDEEKEAMEHADLVLVTYGTLRRDVEALASLRFDYVVLDEAHAIKNAATATAAAVGRLRGKHRLALTGTPVQNHLGELWSLLEFLNPGLLGSAPAFQDAVSTGRDQSVSPALSRAIRPFVLRRTKEQVAPELPERQEQTLLVDLSKAERTFYDRLRSGYRSVLVDRARKEGMHKVRMHVLEALLRLRQAACHPGLVEKARAAESSTKLDTVIARLDEVRGEGHKSLVFSQFTSLLALLRERLDAEGVRYAYLDGQTRDRRQPVDTFQTDPSCGLFLISLKAGGLGLNLTAAEYVFLLDPWWNPAIEAQAIDRAHRIGQARKVLACRIVARGTVEEKILELQDRKRAMAAAVLGENAGLVGKLTADDLELLLST